MSEVQTDVVTWVVARAKPSRQEVSRQPSMVVVPGEGENRVSSRGRERTW